VQDQAEGEAAARLRNEDLKPANLMGLIKSEDNFFGRDWPEPFRQGQFLAPAFTLSPSFGAGARRRGLREHVAKVPCRLLGVTALISGIVCIVTEWGKTENRQGRVRLVWTQAVRWTAVLVVMNIMLLSGVRQLLPAPATSLVLQMLLALGCFLAGLNLASLELCFLWLVVGLAVPALSWVKQSMLFVILAEAFVVGIGMTFWSSRKVS
jgi:hypothetical protein